MATKSAAQVGLLGRLLRLINNENPVPVLKASLSAGKVPGLNRVARAGRHHLISKFKGGNFSCDKFGAVVFIKLGTGSLRDGY